MFAWPVFAAIFVLCLLLIIIFLFEKPAVRNTRYRLITCGILATTTAGAWAAHSQIPAGEGRFVSAQAPRIATFFRSLYATPDFRDRNIPALGEHCCFKNQDTTSLGFEGDVRPHIVVVLQESTFPPNHLKGVSKVDNVLFDGAFPLLVDTVGAGTWVQEYSVLHGVAPPVYGRDFVQILNLGPKLGLSGRLAPMLTEAGYRTVALIPHSEDVLLAGTTYRTLGFEQIHDCGSIPACRDTRDWTNVPDAMLYDHAVKQLRAADAPTLVYMPTIRQHSPHGYGFPKTSYRDEILAEYLRRLDLSANEAGTFLRDLRSLSRPTIVLMFGDHIPADVHEAFGDADFRKARNITFFNVFDASGAGVASKMMADHPDVAAVSAGFLDAIVLKAAGFKDDYIDSKLSLMDLCNGAFCTGAGDAFASNAARQPPIGIASRGANISHP